MLVQRVVMPTGLVSWTVVGADGLPVAPIEGYLAHLAAIERSPNTVRAYAHSLKLFFEFLTTVRQSFDGVGVEDVSRFVAFLRAPVAGVVPLNETAAGRTETTVNRHLAAVFGFYDHQARNGIELAANLVAYRKVGRGSYKPFLHQITRSAPVATRPIRLKVPTKVPLTLSDEQVMLILAACAHRRDRFLFALMAETAIRVGQALGLRHADFVSRERTVRIVPRSDNANGARAKCRQGAEIPISAALTRLYSEYMHVEYGSLDSDYVFVNLWGKPYGGPLTYRAVHGMVARLRTRTGIFFSPHMLRHTRASDLIRSGVAIEVVSKLLTHASVTTTSSIYVHLGVEDLRAELQRAGVWDQGDGFR